MVGSWVGGETGATRWMAVGEQDGDAVSGRPPGPGVDWRRGGASTSSRAGRKQGET
jgi:hypothetical protein